MTRTSLNDAALAFARWVDRLTGRIGHAVAWLTVVMVLVGAANALMRYSGRFIGVNLSRNGYLELQWYLFSIVFLLGGAYVLREDAHVRVDVFFARCSARTQAIINMAGTVLLLVPFSLFVMWVSSPVVRASWAVREGSPDPGGLPRYPLKAMILVCFALLLLQAAAELVKEAQRLRAPDTPRRHSSVEGV